MKTTTFKLVVVTEDHENAETILDSLLADGYERTFDSTTSPFAFGHSEGTEQPTGYRDVPEDSEDTDLKDAWDNQANAAVHDELDTGSGSLSS